MTDTRVSAKNFGDPFYETQCEYIYTYIYIFFKCVVISNALPDINRKIRMYAFKWLPDHVVVVTHHVLIFRSVFVYKLHLVYFTVNICIFLLTCLAVLYCIQLHNNPFLLYSIPLNFSAVFPRVRIFK